MAEKYAVIRTDLMSGTNVASDLVSVKVMNVDTPVAVENGTIVELEGLIDGEREVYKGKVATAESKKENCVIIATPEVFYDERKKNLEEFINEAGTICRGYALSARSICSVTSEGFVSEQAPTKGETVYVGDGGKMTKTAGTIPFGTCMDVETQGRYTFYVIKF